MVIPMEPRITMTVWMKPTGNRSPSATKNQRRHRYVLHVRIIIKNSPTMKIAVMIPAICTDRFGCWNEFEKMSSDHIVIGKVSRADLPTLRGLVARAGKIRASEAIEMSPHEHR